MYRYLVLLLTILICTPSANAATWYGFQKAFNNKLVFFFDADTVIKKNDTVTLWTKYVNNERFPDNDGSYSTAQKVEYSCKKRISRSLSSSIYDKDKQFIQSFGASDKINEIIPDSLGESILTTVCTSDFPKNKSEKLYYRVKDNDIYQHASNLFKYQEDHYTDRAPTSGADWHVFVNAYNDQIMYFFDANSVSKDNDKVTIWAKAVFNQNSQVENGVYSFAIKNIFVCTNNTVQILDESDYDKNAKFIEAFPKPGEIVDIKAGTINEDMLKAVCSPDFPKNTSNEQYSRVAGNDIYGFTANFYKSQQANNTDLAPK